MNDSFNDETFGSSELTSEDRAEERKRRASFELLRKKQQRAFQERQKQKEEFDITTLMEDPSDVTHSNKQGESEKQKAPQSLSTDSQKSSVPMQIPGARPLVPPGFTGTMLEKKSLSVEAKGLMPEYSNSPAANDLLRSGSVFSSKEKQVDDQMNVIGTHVISENSLAEGNRCNLQATLVMLNQLGKKQSEGAAIAEPIGLDHDILADDKVVGQSGHSNSILEKLFWQCLNFRRESYDTEFQASKRDG